jgi:putative toxin-antitoxin system antitoxin component (TIGR02293 family)
MTDEYKFLTLFGLSPDPILYGRIVEIDGLPAKNLKRFAKATGIQEGQIISMLGIRPSTMEKRKEAGQFTAEVAYKILQVARAFDVMIGVLGNAHRALVWFKTPQESLDDQTPLDKCRTESGRNLVNDEVVRIMFNVY